MEGELDCHRQHCGCQTVSMALIWLPLILTWEADTNDT